MVRIVAWLPGAISAALFLASCGLAPSASPGQSARVQTDTRSGEWPVYGGDLGSRKYSPLKQINAETVKDLEISWVWTSSDDVAGANSAAPGARRTLDNFKGTPIMVDGRLFVRTQLGAVEALDPGTGARLWRHAPLNPTMETPRSYGFTTRGVAFWRDEKGRGRILSTTPDRKLLALDAQTGRLIETFGQGGVVDLDASARRVGEDPLYMNYGNQVPMVVGDIIVMGSVVTDAELAYLSPDRQQKPNIPSGDVRGFDARTGQHLWTFHTVPAEGEFGVETWADESWRWVGSTNVWSLMSADPELGYVYLPVTGPTFNYYGGFRKGDNLFGDSIVCLDVRTGRRVWHFQTVHHPVFDYDMPAAPVLADLTIGSRKVKAVVAMNKTGFLYVLDRRTGEPVWPIEERPVPQSDVDGEQTAATQPFPTRPPPVAAQGVSPDKVNRLTPDLAAKTSALLEKYDHGPLYTPVSRRGTILAPGISGGVNWPGGAFDPETGRFFVTAINLPMIRSIEPADNFYGYAFKQIGDGLGGFSLLAPPWGTLTSVDLNEGDLDWQTPNGPGPRGHPALANLSLPELGFASKSNAIVTGSLVFAAHTGRMSYEPKPRPAEIRAAPSVLQASLAALALDNGARLRAYDKATGEVIWSHPIGPSFNDGGAPMTYEWRGRQYLITPTGGGERSSHLIAFALPDNHGVQRP